jgi:hypothetical protein
MKAGSGASKQADPYAIPHIRATRCRAVKTFHVSCYRSENDFSLGKPPYFLV